MRVRSSGGSRYLLRFIDDYSRLCEVYFLKSKGEVFEKLKEYKTPVEKQTGNEIKCSQLDNGLEYCNMAFDSYLNEGIQSTQ